MKNRRTHPTSEQKIRTPHEQLALEAARWEERRITPADFTDAPEAILNVSRSVAISLRMPHQLLELLKRFARREGIGYQILIKRWLDDRLRAELHRIKREKTSNPSEYSRQPRQKTKGHAPGFPLLDRADTNGPRYTPGEQRRVEPGPVSEYRARDGATSHPLRGDMKGAQKLKGGQLRQHINSCAHDGCKATRRLEAAGARFQLGKGRHCEIAMVAAAGNTGLTSNEAVTARREYSEHLRPYGAAELDGPVQNADWANHIDWAITRFVGNPGAKHPINLGHARAECTHGRYRIIWPIGT